MTGLAQGIHTPWPSVDFDRENPPAILSFYVYVNSDRGQEFLLRSSFAVLAAPQANWVLLQSRADNELWTDAEVEENWNLILRDWERNLSIYAYTYADDLSDAYAGRTGSLNRFLLETSTGYREAISGDGLPTRFPGYESDRRRFENSYAFTFDRHQALAPGGEWIRLCVMTMTSRMYFEWWF